MRSRRSVSRSGAANTPNSVSANRPTSTSHCTNRLRPVKVSASGAAILSSSVRRTKPSAPNVATISLADWGSPRGGATAPPRTSGAYRILIFALCTLVMAVDGYDGFVVGYLVPALAQDFGVPWSA
jgi:hypothetical protein